MKASALLLILALSVAACSTSSDAEPAIRPLGEPDATTPTTSTVPSTTTTEPDPWARPTEPDAAYFERVLNELEEIEAVAYRLMIEADTVTPEVEAILRSTKTGLNLEFTLERARSVAAELADDLTFQQAPSFSRTEVVEFTDECAVVLGTISFEGVQTRTREGGAALTLLLATAPTEQNPTGWQIEQRWAVENEPGLSCVPS